MTEVNDEFVKLRGLLFHYRDWGGEGPPLALLHGLASTSHIWDFVAARLRQRFRVVALDQRGHGESAKPDNGYDFDTIVADLLAFVEALGLERPVVVGHSWGGNVALQYAAKHPEMSRGLVLVDGGFTEMGSRMTWEQVEKQLAPPDFSGVTREMFVARAQNWAIGRLWRPELEQAVLANFEVGEDDIIRPRLSRDRHMRILRTLWEQRSSIFFPDVACPVLLVPAAQAPSDERAAQRLEAKRQGVVKAQQLLRRCQVLWLEDTIHDVPLQRPQELAEAITQFVESEVGERARAEGRQT